MAKKESTGEEAPVHRTKKRKHVKLVATNEGIEANNCIKAYIVSHKEQVDSSDAIPVETVDLNVFFDDGGRIYGYQGLKIEIWVNSLSFSVYADIKFQSSSDKGKGITDLKSALQEILGDNLVEEMDDFLRSFDDEANYASALVWTGEVLGRRILQHGDVDRKGHSEDEETSTVEVIRMDLRNDFAKRLYCRLVPLVLLLIDGSNPIDIEDPGWQILFLLHRVRDWHFGHRSLIFGFTTVYRFYHYPDASRLRLGQILVLPRYQRRGHGRFLLETVNYLAEKSEKVYDLTMEEPLENLQHLRTGIDTSRLLHIPSVRHELDSAVARIEQGGKGRCGVVPGPEVVEEVRRRTKINRKQLLQCWDVLIYVGLLAGPDEGAGGFWEFISDRVRAEVIGKGAGPTGKQVVDVPTEHDQEMSFVMFGSGRGEARVEEEQEEQIRVAVAQRVAEIESVARNVPAWRLVG